jgi:hypothetical protein
MTDKFFTDLNANTGLALADLFAVEQRVATTPETTKMTVDDFLDNTWQGRHRIVPSVASNNLTVAIKDMDGNDASATNVISFRVGNTRYDLAAAASYTKNAGTGWHNAGAVETAGEDIDYFVYAIAETGAAAGLKFGHSRISHARTMSDFVNTTTNEKYIAGSWTNFNASDSVAVIGRFRARLSAAAAYNWAIVSSVVIDRPIYETDWLTYAMQWTGSGSAPAIVDGTIAARYRIRYRELFAQARIAMGASTTYGTGTYGFTLPLSSATFTNGTGIGPAYVFDNSTTTFYLGTAIRIGVAGNGMSTRTHGATAALTPTVPITFAVSDEIALIMTTVL